MWFDNRQGQCFVILSEASSTGLHGVVLNEAQWQLYNLLVFILRI
jgi:hypothetical protein